MRILVVLVVLVFIAHSVRGSDDVTRVFLDNAPRAWTDYESSLSCVEGTARRARIDNKTNQVMSDFAYEIVTCRNNAVREVNWFKGQRAGSLSAYGQNADYSFGVTRGTGDADWAIKSVNNLDSSASPPGLSGSVLESVTRIVQAPVRLGLIRLVDVLSHESVQIIDCTEGIDSGQQFVDVSLQADLDIGMGRKVQSARLKFLPQSSWVLVGGELFCQWPGSTEYGIVSLSADIGKLPSGLPVYQTYREHVLGSPNDGSVPIPTEGIEKLLHVPQEWATDVTYAWEYDLRQIEDAPASMFRLTRYGLPEPGRNTAGHSSRWRWILIVVNLGIAAIAAWFLFRQRKQIARFQ